MPNVSQAKFTEMTEAVERAQTDLHEERKRKDTLQQRERQFNTILDKIARTAQGRPLVDDRSGGYGSTFVGGSSYVGISDPHRCQPPTTEELQANEIRSLSERVVSLEARLAAVVAVATFAKDHKA